MPCRVTYVTSDKGFDHETVTRTVRRVVHVHDSGSCAELCPARPEPFVKGRGGGTTGAVPAPGVKPPNRGRARPLARTRQLTPQAPRGAPCSSVTGTSTDGRKTGASPPNGR